MREIQLASSVSPAPGSYLDSCVWANGNVSNFGLNRLRKPNRLRTWNCSAGLRLHPFQNKSWNISIFGVWVPNTYQVEVRQYPWQTIRNVFFKNLHDLDSKPFAQECLKSTASNFRSQVYYNWYNVCMRLYVCWNMYRRNIKVHKMFFDLLVIGPNNFLEGHTMFA